VGSWRSGDREPRGAPSSLSANVRAPRHAWRTGPIQVGRNLMVHFFTLGRVAMVADRPAPAGRDPTTNLQGRRLRGANTSRPEGEGRRPPYLKGGHLRDRRHLPSSRRAPSLAGATEYWGRGHKDLMRSSPFRAHLAACRCRRGHAFRRPTGVDPRPEVATSTASGAAASRFSRHNFEGRPRPR